MGAPISVRQVTMADYKRVAEIYSQGIAERIATFETKPKTWDDVQNLVETDPIFLVAYDDVDLIVGFARISPTSQRAVYTGVGEISVYVDKDHRAQGIGSLLMKASAAAAKQAGFWKLIAKIFPENEPSLAVFAKSGYRSVGTHYKHARLDGEWRDVCLLELLLNPTANS